VGSVWAGCCHLPPPWALLAELDAVIDNSDNSDNGSTV
jgi:hypothetical protein